MRDWWLKGGVGAEAWRNVNECIHTHVLTHHRCCLPALLPWLSCPSPPLHRTHGNYASSFAFWDLLCGTYIEPDGGGGGGGGGGRKQKKGL